MRPQRHRLLFFAMGLIPVSPQIDSRDLCTPSLAALALVRSSTQMIQVHNTIGAAVQDAGPQAASYAGLSAESEGYDSAEVHPMFAKQWMGSREDIRQAASNILGVDLEKVTLEKLERFFADDFPPVKRKDPRAMEYPSGALPH